jgi:hypothetical protein
MGRGLQLRVHRPGGRGIKPCLKKRKDQPFPSLGGAVGKHHHGHPLGAKDPVDLLEGFPQEVLVVLLGEFQPLFATAEAGRIDHRLLFLGHQTGAKGLRVKIAHDSPKPHIEKVGKIGIRAHCPHKADR